MGYSTCCNPRTTWHMSSTTVRHRAGCFAGNVLNQVEPALTLQQTHYCTAALLTQHGIDFPISHTAPLIDYRRAFINRYRIGNDTAFAVLTLAIAFVTLTQMPV